MLDRLDTVAVSTQRLQAFRLVERREIIRPAVPVDVVRTLRGRHEPGLHALTVLGVELAVHPHSAERVPCQPALRELCPAVGEATLVRGASSVIALLRVRCAESACGQLRTGRMRAGLQERGRHSGYRSRSNESRAWLPIHGFDR